MSMISDLVEKLRWIADYEYQNRNSEVTIRKAADTIEMLSEKARATEQGWISCSERLPETDNTNEINEFDVLLAVRPKKHPERAPQVYIGKLRPVEGDDGSGNFWGVKIAPCEWTIWGWSYFQEPEVLAWMPLPESYKGADDESTL